MAEHCVDSIDNGCFGIYCDHHLRIIQVSHLKNKKVELRASVWAPIICCSMIISQENRLETMMVMMNFATARSTLKRISCTYKRFDCHISAVWLFIWWLFPTSL